MEPGKLEKVRLPCLSGNPQSKMVTVSPREKLKLPFSSVDIRVTANAIALLSHEYTRHQAIRESTGNEESHLQNEE